MPGPLLIKETEQGKCEWFISEEICQEETQLRASQLSRAQPRIPSPDRAWRGLHLLPSCLSYSGLGASAKYLVGNPCRTGSEMTSRVFSFPLTLL